KDSMRQKELGWHVALYNLKRTIKTSNEKEIQLFLFFKIEMVSFGTTPALPEHNRVCLLFDNFQYS
ncbi:MAG: hypothetical protein KKD18_02350, partial [Nanoarchaeota archaeon]|nr:hypothetical protein [Nanoarchaeota archaeon]MBU0977232.1 hypothetical protein [Nanoarchaeota archaeon]